MANRVIRGSSIRIGDKEFEMPNVVEQIVLAMEEDKDSPDTINELLIKDYAEADSITRKIIDDWTCDITGWSFPTLLRQCGAGDDLLEAMGLPLHSQSKPVDDDDDSDLD